LFQLLHVGIKGLLSKHEVLLKYLLGLCKSIQKVTFMLPHMVMKEVSCEVRLLEDSQGDGIGLVWKSKGYNGFCPERRQIGDDVSN